MKTTNRGWIHGRLFNLMRESSSSDMIESIKRMSSEITQMSSSMKDNWEVEKHKDILKAGKRPLGNSDWRTDLYLALIDAGVIEGKFDEDGDLEDFDDDAADQILRMALLEL